MAVGIPLDFSALDARCTCETTWIYSSSLLEAGRLYVATTTVTHNPPNQGGGGWGQDLYRCRCQVFGEVFPSSSPRWAPFLGKAFIIEASHLNLSTWIDCWFFLPVCSVSREDSSQSLTSCFNLLPSPMDPTGDRIPGKGSSQRYACAYKCDVHIQGPRPSWKLDLKGCPWRGTMFVLWTSAGSSRILFHAFWANLK